MTNYLKTRYGSVLAELRLKAGQSAKSVKALDARKSEKRDKPVFCINCGRKLGQQLVMNGLDRHVSNCHKPKDN